jgi:hypothetical protein
VDKALLEVETKEAQAFTCRACNSPNTDGSDGGSGSKKNYGVCRAAEGGRCEHGRKESKGRDCGMGHCEHGALEEQLQGLRRGPLRARAQEEPVQGLRHPGHPPARTEEEAGGGGPVKGGKQARYRAAHHCASSRPLCRGNSHLGGAGTTKRSGVGHSTTRCSLN